MGPYKTVLADVVALKLPELRFFHPGPERSITAHADGIECPVVIRPVVERRRGGHLVGQSGTFRERLSLKDADRQGTFRPLLLVSFTRHRHFPCHHFALLASITMRAIAIESLMIDRARGLLFWISPDSTRASFTAAISPVTTAKAPADFSVETASENGARKRFFVGYWRVSSQC
jgi:hypothetical protein